MTWLLIGGLALATFALRGTGPVLPRIPQALTQRTTGLAPALLAALVMTQLVTGGWHLDVKAAAVAVATALAALRAPLLASVIAGAAVAAGLRLLLRVS
ncbi:MAG TPA: AzlD domain-containing protein [Candidatus Eisenbacteria bacterium]|jgi:branched-subunit amino acid transport protein|nr:AzlD domain-containing protein [Candidatus Eisenbacteria bacterium]